MKKISILLILFLSSCKAVGPDYQRPTPNLPATFSESDSGNAADAKNWQKQWWQHFEDEQLNKLINKSLNNNVDIQLAISRIEEADASLREVGATLFPQVNVSSQATRNKVTELGAFPTFGSPIRNNYTLNLNTSYEIDFWGKVRRARESAMASAQSVRYAKETVEMSIVSVVASNYLQLIGLDAQISVTLNNQQNAIEALKLNQRRLDGGVASRLELSQSEVLATNLEAQLIELNRLRALSEHQIALLTGELDLKIAPADIRKLAVAPVPPAGLPSELLENRPDIRQAELALVAQNALIGVAKAALYPSISLTGLYGSESLALSNLLKSGARVWTLGLGLDLPIFDAGRRNSVVAQVTARQKQALTQYQIAIQNAFAEVNDALISRRLNAARESSLNQSQMSAQSALRVAENRYKAGYSTYLEVLDAQRERNDASNAYIQAKQASFLASVELFRALGGDWKIKAEDNVNQ